MYIENDTIPTNEILGVNIEHDLELQRSIELVGQQVPIIVECTQGDHALEYRVVAGQRRVSACRALGIEEIHARIFFRDPDEGEVEFAQKLKHIVVAENMVRERNPGAEADALWSLIDSELIDTVESGDYREALSRLAKKTGINKPKLRAMIDLKVGLTKIAYAYLKEGSISLSVAKQLRRLPDRIQYELCDKRFPPGSDIRAKIQELKSAEQTSLLDALPEMPTSIGPVETAITQLQILLDAGLCHEARPDIERCLGSLKREMAY